MRLAKGCNIIVLSARYGGIAMNYFELRKIRKVIRELAESKGLPESYVRAEMEQAILEARNNPDPETRAKFAEMFGDVTPSVEEFLHALSRKMHV